MTVRQFDFYEFASVFAPGMVLLVITALISPGFFDGLQTLEVSLGGFGLVLVVSYVVGHLLQALGNILEAGWWKLQGGWPSDWPRSRKGKLLAESQIAKLQERVRRDLGWPDITLDSRLPAYAWHPVFRQIYARVRAAGCDDRAHTFNGNYGMFRGIATALILSAGLVLLVRGMGAWPLAAALIGAAVLAIARMHRFAKHYARETYVQYLTLPPADEGKT
jgi:hypothetical protein